TSQSVERLAALWSNARLNPDRARESERGLRTNSYLHTAPRLALVARFGPTSMRKPLSRPERDDCGTSQTSIRRHPQRQSARGVYAVAPLQYRGVALRHVGPRDAAWVPLSISTWTASSPLGLCASGRGASGNKQRSLKRVTHLSDQICGRNRER